VKGTLVPVLKPSIIRLGECINGSHCKRTGDETLLSQPPTLKDCYVPAIENKYEKSMARKTKLISKGRCCVFSPASQYLYCAVAWAML